MSCFIKYSSVAGTILFFPKFEIDFMIKSEINSQCSKTLSLQNTLTKICNYNIDLL